MKLKLFIFLLVPVLSFASYTLNDVMEACPAVANAAPSVLTAPCGGKALTIHGKVYELRLFTFEQKDVVQTDAPTFKEFITQWKLLESAPRQHPEALNPTDYFSSTPAMKEKGYYFLLVLREIANPKIVSQLQARAN